MSDSARQRSREFLNIADQFKLGELVTEGSHPVTANLSEVASGDIADALKLLFKVDEDVLAKYEEVARSGRLQIIARTVVDALRAGGRLFFTGCGSTGRLSILLDSIWRDYWEQAGQVASEVWRDRTFSVMAGGDYALIKAVEGFEDYATFGRKQIRDLGVKAGDVVFAITEGGETSFVIGTAWEGVGAGPTVYFVYNNPDDVLCQHVQRSREVIEDAHIEKLNLTTGPMAISGSTRMQATSIQLAVLLTVLEMVVRELIGPGSGVSPVSSPREGLNPCPEQFLAAFTWLHATFQNTGVLSQLARLVALEESVYRGGGMNNYYADRVGIDVLTDTTERSPTYCTPPFRKFDDAAATDSWAFLFVPRPDSPAAWEHICQRKPQCVEWKSEEVRGLVPEEKLERTLETISRINYGELMRFHIGLDGIKNRPLGPGDSAVALVVESEIESFFAPDGFQRVQLEAAVKAGARTGLIFLGSEVSCREVDEFVAQWNPQCIAVLVPTPKTDLLLDGVMRVGLKMLLNALSTCTMVRLGRVMGNTMIWVVPSNLKLIDRATRYIANLASLDYVPANQVLFEVIEYVEPRMKADQAYPPVVAMAVLRARHGLSNEHAERKLMEGLGQAFPGGLLR